MANTHDIGDLVKITAAFADTDGAAVDPTAVTCYYKDPSGNISELVYGVDTDVVKSDTGSYYTTIAVDESGSWYYRWKGTGAVIAAAEDWFSVRQLEVST